MPRKIIQNSGSLRWENISEEHMDILKHLQCLKVMYVCLLSLFMHPAATLITYLYCKVHYDVSGYLHISAEHFNMYSLEIIEIGKHFI